MLRSSSAVRRRLPASRPVICPPATGPDAVPRTLVRGDRLLNRERIESVGRQPRGIDVHAHLPRASADEGHLRHVVDFGDGVAQLGGERPQLVVARSAPTTRVTARIGTSSIERGLTIGPMTPGGMRSALAASF